MGLAEGCESVLLLLCSGVPVPLPLLIGSALQNSVECEVLPSDEVRTGSLSDSSLGVQHPPVSYGVPFVSKFKKSEYYKDCSDI